MKKQKYHYLFILIFYLITLTNASAQNITTFFKILPMPGSFQGWVFNNKLKAVLLEKQNLSRDDLDSLGVSSQYVYDLEAIIDIQNGYMSIHSDNHSLDLCYWKYKDAYTNEDRYLVGICHNSSDTNGPATESIFLYTVFPDGRFFPMPFEYLTGNLRITDFFKDHATRKDMDDSFATLVYELPRKGKAIKVRCDLGDGDGSSDRIRNAIPLMKGNMIELDFYKEGAYFTKGEPKNTPSE